MIASASEPMSADEPLRDWIIEQGLGADTLSALLDGLVVRLVEAGMPIWRASLALPTVSPQTRAVVHSWSRDEGGSQDDVEHDRDRSEFEASPFGRMLRDDVMARRWRLERAAEPADHAVLVDLRRLGATDYLAHLVPFGGSRSSALAGVAMSVATDRPGGFSDAQAARLTAIVPLVALAAYRIALFDVTVGVLGAYLGADAGQRVLSGEMQRGVGHALTAALMVADLQGFTAAADTGGEGLVARLGEHLGAMVEPIEAAGGEVLKFLGDGLLAAFQVDEGEPPDRACAAALAAALHALRLNETVNARHAPELKLDVSLHLGEVYYGNIGAGRRLDFTVIGPAVNEASRLEGLCGQLGEPLLMSAPFARCCGQPTVSLGLHRLRGVAEPREVFRVDTPLPLPQGR